MKLFQRFADVDDWVRGRLHYQSHIVESRRWQGVDISSKPEMVMHEVLNISFGWVMPDSVEELKAEVKPHLPWAEDHFQERVAGNPVNPGEQYKNWPFYKHRKENDKFRTAGDEQFTHTYMERYWTPALFGIRYSYGNLDDVGDQLLYDPFTRQAYLPVWFPEDTGAKHRGRVPCTLGYHFIRRHDKLHVTYYIRSCDLLRHFRDDVYMSVRLGQYLLDWLKSADQHDVWQDVTMGLFTFHCVSMHMFAADRKALGWL